MAQGFTFICLNCDHMIEAWNDGNPYYFEWVITKAGKLKQKKKYAYHPSHEFERCVGNDAEYLCLSCKKEFMVDSQAPITTCQKCKSSEIVPTMELDGKSCPYCKQGVFESGPGAIS